MRRRALKMVVHSLLVTVTILGVPLAITAALTVGVWHSVSLVIIGCGLAFLAGSAFALRGSRRLAAPLIYLAAQAEQIGSGGVQPQQIASGIEEIDLVSEELARTSQRVAGRIAKERQFAADVAHQLRTPLSALSMRIEEIDYLSEDQSIAEECEACLTQIERMIGIMDDLRSRSSKTPSTAQAIRIEEIFGQQLLEWEDSYRVAGRELVFESQVQDRLPLATPGSLSQAIATLIENALKYGEGKVKVATRAGVSARSIFIDVSDEGPGVAEELAPNIFRRGVSGHGSTGIGLALAKDLVEADGGRLELTRRQPPVFTISLSAVTESLAPEKVIPKGVVFSVGRRRRSW